MAANTTSLNGLAKESAEVGPDAAATLASTPTMTEKTSAEKGSIVNEALPEGVEGTVSWTANEEQTLVRRLGE